jgi:hemolysin activation/secretion protein
MALTSQAFAQTNRPVLAQANIPTLPGAVQPSQVSQAISSQQPKRKSEVLPPVVSKQAAAKPGLPPEAQKIKFQLNGVNVVGNRVFSDAQLRPIYAKDLHKTIAVARLFEIVQSITNYYRNSGYILSRAILPPQHVKGGIIKIEVIEGYIADVTVTGKPRGAKCMVLKYGNKIKECPPLKISRMEKYMYLANEIPGTQVRAVLSASKTEKGAADLAMVTENRPVTAYASYDNYGTRYIGPQQMTGNIALDSFLKSGDMGQVTFSKTPKGIELTYLDANYTLPIGAEGLRWQFGGTRVLTHPLFILQPVQINGLNSNYYTMLTFPAIRERSKSLTFRGGFNYLDTWVTTFGQQLYTDHLRSLDLGLTYTFADKWYGSNFISTDLRQGLPIWDYTANTNINTAQTSRPGGRGRYTKIALTLSRVQAIKGPWSIYGIFQGQWAFMPLLAPEQFTFGGPVIGRGYDVAEIIGDRGMDGSLELRYDWAIQRFKLQNLQFYAFYDAGVVWNYELIGGVPLRQSGTSTGLGVRFYANKYISGNVMWTKTLTKEIAALDLIGQGQNPRVFFSIVASI